MAQCTLELPIHNSYLVGSSQIGARFMYFESLEKDDCNFTSQDVIKSMTFF